MLYTTRALGHFSLNRFSWLQGFDSRKRVQFRERLSARQFFKAEYKNLGLVRENSMPENYAIEKKSLLESFLRTVNSISAVANSKIDLPCQSPVSFSVGILQKQLFYNIKIKMSVRLERSFSNLAILNASNFQRLEKINRIALVSTFVDSSIWYQPWS